MKQLKQFLNTFSVLMAAAALAAINTGCTASAKKAYHEKRANQFYAEGDLDKAEIEYKNVLRAVPTDPSAISRLGLIYFQEGRLQTAAPYLLKGSELATNDLEVRGKLGFVYAAMGRLSDARDSANFVLDRQPQNPEMPLLLVQAVGGKKDEATVRARLQKLIAAGDHPALEVAMGNLAVRDQDLQAAATYFQRALALDPKFGQALVGIATLDLAENDLTNAVIHFKAAADGAPPRSPLKVLYARFKVETGDLAGGIQILNDIVKQTPDYLPALMGLAQISFSQKQADECQKYVDKILARDPDNFDAQMLDSQLKLVHGDPAGATAELERMTHLYGQVPLLQYQLAQAYLAGNDSAKATVCLGRALDLNPDYADAIILLARIQIQNQNSDPAIFALQKLVQKRPQLIEAQLLLADVYRQNNRVADAMPIYSSLEKQFPKNPQIPLLAGAAFAQLNDDVSARREFNRALELKPTNLLALEQIVNLDLDEKQFDTAMQRVQSRLQTSPNEVDLYVMEAKVYLAENQRDQAEASLLKGLQKDPTNPNVNLLLAQLYINSKQNDKALTQLDSALSKDPKNLSALMLKAQIYGLTSDYKKQADVYETMLQIDPKCSLALNNLAYIYSQYLNNVDRAYDLAQRARVLLPYDPSTADTLGWICYQRGSYPAALSLLQESASKAANQPEIQYHLGMVNYVLGNEDKARTAFQAALQIGTPFSESDECKTCLAVLAINPETADAAAIAALEKRVSQKSDDTIALGRLAAIYQRAGNSDKAIADYEAILKIFPNNLAAMLNLTQLYAPKDSAKAYSLAKAAYTAASDNPVAAHVYGRLAYQNGDYKLANTLLQQTAQSQPNDPQSLFELGQSAYSVGKISDARAALQNALQLNLAAPQSADAKQMLDLMDLAANPAQAVAATSRVSALLKSSPNYVPALAVAGVIDEQNANATAAAVAYEKILAQYPDFSPAQRELAILYSPNPDKAAQAADLISKARMVYADDIFLTKASGIVAYQQGDFPRAISLLKTAAVTLPNDAQIFYYLGAAQFKSKDTVGAKTSLQKALALNLTGSATDDAKQMLGQLK